ncbi:MAG: glucose-1-phosphate adenylyltransferase [Candidatus Omnitrophota bacterium]|jgi:glucose-1-phosphate adenylyltransferase|nr:MAG: glucose-1-phosphate adenylyltransferase [Candidatus Omnitrophota bacterium]
MIATLPPFLRNTLTLILAGGQGERLFPLTKDRSKPAVPFAGNFRIIDFTLSNCLNSGLRRIYMLTQYKSQSLDRHIRNGWNFLSRELNEFIETVPPQRRTISRWYEGTADAIYQNIYLFEQHKPDRVVILSGDHIYQMDYFDMIAYHVQKQAEVTIASIEYKREEASSFGVLSVDENNRITDFIEKPSDPPPIPGKPDQSLVNMGVYVFNTVPLIRAIIEDGKNSDSSHDIGKNICPRLVHQDQITLYAYNLSCQNPQSYWRDVGSIDGYYDATMDLLVPGRSIDLYSKDWPFRTDAYHPLPASINLDTPTPGRIECSIISYGCMIEGNLHRCVISPEVRIGRDSDLHGCVVFNQTVIGRRCKIRNTIIDKQVVIPDDCVIGYDQEKDRKQFMVTENGLVVIPKGLKVEQ